MIENVGAFERAPQLWQVGLEDAGDRVYRALVAPIGDGAVNQLLAFARSILDARTWAVVPDRWTHIALAGGERLPMRRAPLVRPMLVDLVGVSAIGNSLRVDAESPALTAEAIKLNLDPTPLAVTIAYALTSIAAADVARVRAALAAHLGDGIKAIASKIEYRASPTTDGPWSFERLPI